MHLIRTAALTALLVLTGTSAAYADVTDEYTQNEILQAATGFFSESSRDLANAVAKAFEDNGRPNAYITGEEASGAIGIGLRYGNGILTRKKFDLSKIYWQGPSIGFDLGGDATVFCHNRDRLLEAEVSALLLKGVVEHRKVRRLLSCDHFSVDGTLIEAWASMKSFRAKAGDDDDRPPGRNAERDFRGEKRSNESHQSTTDPDARLYRKGNGRRC